MSTLSRFKQLLRDLCLVRNHPGDIEASFRVYNEPFSIFEEAFELSYENLTPAVKAAYCALAAQHNHSAALHTMFDQGYRALLNNNDEIQVVLFGG